ncbi:MAG TPA: protein phosphatase CheZ [Stellaceae bacterium]|nr:protein phosphatase CheZ [Stellaceae bacterium]
MSNANRESALKRTLESLDTNAVHASASDIAAVVEAVMKSLSGDVSIAEFKLYHELQKLADYIQSAKREIAAIRPDEIRATHIPMATDELDAVVGATAEATGVILDSAEQLETVAGKVAGAAAEEIRNIATRIYEACNFQDVTGQRITKVVRALKHIEEKIDALLSAFGEGVRGPDVPVPPPAPSAPAPSDDKALLHGPSMPQEANKQDDIDAILANLK